MFLLSHFKREKAPSFSFPYETIFPSTSVNYYLAQNHHVQTSLLYQFDWMRLRMSASASCHTFLISYSFIYTCVPGQRKGPLRHLPFSSYTPCQTEGQNTEFQISLDYFVVRGALFSYHGTMSLWSLVLRQCTFQQMTEKGPLGRCLRELTRNNSTHVHNAFKMCFPQDSIFQASDFKLVYLG